MIRLRESEALGRKIRQDDVVDQAILTRTLVEEAIKAKRKDDALEFLDYLCAENQAIHDGIVGMIDATISYLARLDEKEIPKLMRQRFSERIQKWLKDTPDLEESIQRFTEYQRGHFGTSTVLEEPDRYVITLDPCGTGGRLMRSKQVSTTKKAYPWSWSKSGVPYYCVHCCMAWEIIPTELRGYPLRINLVPEKPGDPCIHLFYKKPELIPEEYFTRIGMKKTIE